MKIFRVSAAGRLQIFLYVLATLVLFVFATWFLLDSLGLRLGDWAASWQTAQASWTIGLLVPALGLLVVVLASPFLLWQLLADAMLRFKLDQHGLHVQTLGLSQFWPWQAIEGLKPVYSRDEPDAIDVVVPREAGLQIRKRLLQLHGRVPVPAGLVDRKQFLHVLRQELIHAQIALSEHQDSIIIEERS